ncbi:uncharacterized protein LOC135484544 isoform X2 [Lineus longissimus]|uniref:uncharacterized protein LOC135484544 isoform X2 n=1 Tax=Lineus longissimus TaxID=88925 RepID=UPI00315D0018
MLLRLASFIVFLSSARFCLGLVDLVLPGTDFIPDSANKIAYKNIPTVLKFTLKIQNDGGTPVTANSGKKLYAVGFYFTYFDVSGADLTSTTFSQLTPSGTVALDFGLNTNDKSAALTFETSATLPVANCGSFRYLCACVEDGPDAASPDDPTTNNCACKEAKISALISCALVPADIQVTSFTADASNKVAYQGNPTTLKFSLAIKNGDANNAIGAVAAGEKNYNVLFYFASTPTTPTNIATATRKKQMTNTGTSPALDFGLSAGASSASLLTFETSGTLPTTDCIDYNRFCACVEVGPQAAYTDSTTTNNCDCIVALKKTATKVYLISCKPDLDLTDADVTPDSSNPVALMGTPVTLKFTVKITNSIVNTLDAGTIEKLDAGKKNYALAFYFSSANQDDITTASGVKISKMINTGTSPGLDFGMEPGILSSPMTFEAIATLPITDCKDYTFFCACVSPGPDALYEDFDNRPQDCGCTAVGTKISCADIKPKTFTAISTNPIALKNIEVALKFSLQIENVGAAPGDIAGVAPGLRNYDAAFYFALGDLETATTAGKVALTNTLEPTNLNFTLGVGTTSTETLTFEAKGTLQSANCNNYKWLCVCISKGAAANYGDDTSNNCACKESLIPPSMSLISCSSDIKAKAFDPKGAAATYPIFIKNTATDLTNFNFDIENAASAGLGNNIRAVTTGDNFAVDVYLATANLGTTPVGSTAYAATANLATDLQVGLNAGAATGNKVFTATGITLPATNCNLYTWLCACVKKGDAAQYVDDDSSNNCKCTDASANTVCGPDIVPTTLAVPATPSMIIQEKTFTLTGITVKIKNQATGTGNDIQPVAAAKFNYAVEVYLAQVDLKTTYSGTKTTLITPTKDAGDLFVGLAAGSTTAGANTLTFTASNVKLPKTGCSLYKYICLCIKEGADAQYVDSDATNNCECEDASSRMRCHPDVEVTSFTVASDAVFTHTDPSLNVEFSVAFKNKGTTSTEDIVALTATPDENFHLKFTQSNINTMAPGGCPNPLSTPEFASSTEVILDSPNEVYNGLLFGNSLTMKGKLAIALNSTNCGNLIYLCANVEPKDKSPPIDSAPYTDNDLNNNCMCTDIKSYISCNPDLEVTTFTTVPDASSPMKGTLGLSGQTFTVILANAGTANDRNNIRAATGTNYNFAFTGYYATSATPTNNPPATATGINAYRFTINLATSDLQRGIDALTSSTFIGTIDYPALSSADCQMALYACIFVSPDNRANGGTFVDHDATNNYKCLQLILMCDPDIHGASFTPPAGAAYPDFIVNKATDLTNFTFSIQNAATGAKNDILASTTGDNFAVDVYFAKANLVTTPQGTKSTAFVATAGALDLKVALAAGATSLDNKLFTANGITLPTTDCNLFTWLCACVKQGTGAHYVDADTNNNCDCQDAKAKISCFPDIIPTSLSLVSVTAPSPLIFFEDVQVTLVALKANIENQATGIGNNIPASAGDNYAIDVYFAKASAKTTPTGSTAYTALATAGDLKKALAVGASESFNLTVNNMKLPSTDCVQYTWLCVCVKEGAGANFKDSVTTNNCDCLDISPMIYCKPDVEVTSFTFDSNAVFPHTVKSDVEFSVVITNKGTIAGQTITPTTPAGDANTDENFHVKFTQSNVGAPVGCTNPLTGPPAQFEPPTDVVLDSPNDAYNGLAISASLNIKGTLNIALDSTNCLILTYLCVEVAAKDNGPAGLPYTDSDTTNNCICRDFKDYITCDPKLKVSAFSVIPDSGNPMIGTNGMTGQALSVTLVNIGTFNDRNNIRAATGINYNFAFTGYYATSATPTNNPPATATGINAYRFTINLATSDLQSALVANVTSPPPLTLTGTIDYPKLLLADCINPLYACIHVSPDNRAKGGTFVDKDTSDDYLCSVVTVTCRPDPKPDNLQLLTPTAANKIIPDTLTAIEFSVDVRNEAATAPKNDIPTVTGSLTHFIVHIMFSDVDLSITSLDTLNLGAISTVFPNTADNQVNLVAGPGAAKTLGGTVGKRGTAQVTIPEATCAKVKYFCALLYASKDARYVDLSTETNPGNMTLNTTCILITDRLECNPDVDVTALTFPSGGVFPMAPIEADVSFSVTFKNIRSKDIAAVTTPDENFHIKIYQSDRDLRAVTSASLNPLGVTVFEPTTNVELLITDVVKYGLKGGQSLTISGKFKFGLNTTECAKINYLCIEIAPTGSPPYVDADTTNNYICANINAMRTCEPDIEVVAFSKYPDLGDLGPMIGTAGMASQPLSLTLRNKAAVTPSNDIRQAAGPSDVNYALTGYYSKTDAAPTAANTALYGAFTISLTASELRRAMPAVGTTGATTILTGTITYPPLSKANCLSLTTPRACIYVALDNRANGGTFVEQDATKASNFKCFQIIMTCRPDPKPTNLVIQAGTPLTVNSATTIEYSLDVENAATGANNGVPGVLSGGFTNFKFELQFCDVNLEVQQTCGSGVPTGRFSSSINTAENQRAIAAGATVNYGITGTRINATVILSEAACSSVKFLCAILSTSSNARYIDASTEASPSDFRLNTACATFATTGSKVCHPDIEMTALNEANNAVMLMNVDTTLQFDVTLRNNDANTDIATQTVTTNENFHLKFVFSNSDYRVSGEASNTVTGPPTFENTGVVDVVPAADVRLGLNARQSLTLKGTVKVKIPNSAAICAAIRYICANSMPNATEYIEDSTRLLNNWLCKDIRNQVSCGIDVEIVSFSDLPTASDPLVGPNGKTITSFAVNVRNRGTGGQGFDIAAVTSPKKNFALTSFYSDIAQPTTAANEIGTANIMTVTNDANLRMALPGVGPSGATTAISGTLAYSALTDADCHKANFICMKILEVPGEASYTEPNDTLPSTTVGPNTRCLTLAGVRTCAPDPSPKNLALNTNLAVDSTTLVDFTVQIENKATDAKDSILAATSPNYNYKFELQLSDVDIENVGPLKDTLGLAKVSTTISDAELRALLAGGGSHTITTGQAQITLTAVKCPKVQYLCAFLSTGTGAAYVDSNHTNNIVCVGILAKKGCTPDPSILDWGLTATTPLPLIYVQDVWQDLTVKLDLKNIANGALSNIAAASTWNYNIFIKFTNMDLATSISAVNSSVPFFYVPAGDLKANLGRGATLSLGGSVRLAIEKAKCQELNYLCAIMHHNSLLYNDKETKNNVKCIDVTLTKVCAPDVDITSFTDNPKTQLIKDSTAGTFIFDIAWKNIADPYPGNDIRTPPTTPANSKNFKFQMTFSDVNIGLGGADTLAIAKISVTTQYTESLKAKTGLITKNSVTIPTGDNLVIPVAHCSKVKFLCIFIEEGDNAQYADANKTNNVECLDINIATGTAGSKKNCRPEFTNLDASVDMNENTATGVSIFTVSATQGDLGVPSTLTFSLDSTVPAAAPFLVQTTGVVTTNLAGGAVFDYETTAKQYKLLIMVNDGTADPLYSVTNTLTVNIKDVNEIPVFNPATYTVNPAIPENTATSVYKMTVDDPDRPHQTMTYSIEINPSVNPGAPFSIVQTGLYSDGVISLTGTGFNFEAASTYSLTVHVTDDGTPPLSANPLGLIVVPGSDIPEKPTIKDLPRTISLSEDVANTYNTPIYTITATDPDKSTTLKYDIDVQPYDGKIIIEDTNVIKYKANPDFDHETVSEYTVTVIVYDGDTAPQTGVLTVKILNSTYGDLPIIDASTWPAAVSVPEDQARLAYVYDVVAKDPDGRPLTYSLDQVPYTNPGQFAIDSMGKVHSVVNPRLDFETVPVYTLKINVCAYAINCTSKTLTVNVEDKNDDPVCTPSALEVSAPEGNYAPGKLFTMTDQDAGDTVTYAKVTTTTQQAHFTINTAGIVSVTNLNYETLYSPIIGAFTATDSKGAKCNFALTVNILDVNENPVFVKEPYKGTINEDDPTDTSILTVEATDTDIGNNGVLSFEVLAGANNVENNFKLTKIAGADKAVLKVQSPKDRESMTSNVVTFQVVVRDGGGGTDTSTVTVTVNNVNDNKPTFTQELYNFEMMYNDTKGHVLGSVSCTDKDVAFNVPSYGWLEDQLKDNFIVDSTTGVVASAITPLTPHHEYVLLVECKDNDPVKQETSLTHVVRVDTYYGWEIVTNWTTSKPKTFYDTKANLDDFLAGASKLCAPGCVAKLHSRTTNSKGNEVLAIYFLKDASTDSLGNIGKQKEFISATDTIGAYTTDKLKTPASSVTASTILSAHGVTSIIRYGDAPNNFNWMLDTIAGQAIIGVCMFAALAVLLVTVVCITRKACPLKNYKRQRLDSPSRPYQRRHKVAPSPQPPRRELTAESVDSIATASHVKFDTRSNRSIPLQKMDKSKALKDSTNAYRSHQQGMY